MAKKNAERERALELVETAILQGIERPTAIARVVPGITRTTAAKYVKIIEKRWATRDGIDARENLRRRLIEQAKHAVRRAYEAHAIAINKDNINGAVAALKQALTAQERIAKLTGLDTERIEHSVDEATLERLRGDAIAEAERELNENPLHILYGPSKTE